MMQGGNPRPSASLDTVIELKNYIRDVADFPRTGIVFKDITPLLKDTTAFRHVIETFANYYKDQLIDVILGVEARGFLLAAPIAFRLEKPLVPIRKEGKLPFETHSVKYALEYGEDAVEVHTDAIAPGQRALLVDDLLATGGSLAAAARLVEATGGQVAGLAVLVELVDLRGRERLRGHDLLSLVQYP